MRIGTYNVLGLSGYPPQEAGQILGNPTSEQTAAHFQDVFQDLDCDILALQEGVSPSQIRQIAIAMNCHAVTNPVSHRMAGACDLAISGRGVQLVFSRITERSGPSLQQNCRRCSAAGRRRPVDLDCRCASASGADRAPERGSRYCGEPDCNTAE